MTSPAVHPLPPHFSVREATFELLRSLGMTTIFGNPGSTELPLLLSTSRAISARCSACRNRSP